MKLSERLPFVLASVLRATNAAVSRLPLSFVRNATAQLATVLYDDKRLPSLLPTVAWSETQKTRALVECLGTLKWVSRYNTDETFRTMAQAINNSPQAQTGLNQTNERIEHTLVNMCVALLAHCPPQTTDDQRKVVEALRPHDQALTWSEVLDAFVNGPLTPQTRQTLVYYACHAHSEHLRSQNATWKMSDEPLFALEKASTFVANTLDVDWRQSVEERFMPPLPPVQSLVKALSLDTPLPLWALAVPVLPLPLLLQLLHRQPSLCNEEFFLHVLAVRPSLSIELLEFVDQHAPVPQPTAMAAFDSAHVLRNPLVHVHTPTARGHFYNHLVAYHEHAALFAQRERLRAAVEEKAHDTPGEISVETSPALPRRKM